MDEQKLRKLTDELKDMMIAFSDEIAMLALSDQDKLIRQYETEIFNKLKEYNNG